MYMRSSATAILLFVLCLGAAQAQTWEVGGSAGFGIYRDLSLSSPAASGKIGFEPGFNAGAVFGNDLYRFIGGEVRYTYISDDLRVSSGGTKVTFGGQSHAIHYDVLLHARSKESAVRPFFAVGAGMKFYRGTGAEQVYQPLGNLAVLTHTSQPEALISVGGGVKYRLSPRALIRVDFRDYLTPVPDELFATPAPKVSGWFHDFVVMVGVSTTFSRIRGGDTM